MDHLATDHLATDHLELDLVAPTDAFAVPPWAWMLTAFSVLSIALITMDSSFAIGHVAENLHELFHDARHFAGAPCH